MSKIDEWRAIGLDWNKRVEFINKCMSELDENGNFKSLRSVCAEIKIDKSISKKFKEHGFELVNGQFVKQQQQIEGQQDLFKTTEIIPKVKRELTISKEEMEQYKSLLNETSKALELQKIEKGINILPNTKEAVVSQNNYADEVKQVGRPRKENKTKLNLSIDEDLKLEIQMYCLINKITVSDLAEELFQKFLAEN